jgi:hypothetical protein
MKDRKEKLSFTERYGNWHKKSRLRFIWVMLLYTAICIRDIKKVKLMETVYYLDEPCVLIQGVSNPYWRLMPNTDENLRREKRVVYENIHVSEFKREPFYKRVTFSFTSTFRWLMAYWYSIDMQKRRNLWSYFRGGRII